MAEMSKDSFKSLQCAKSIRSSDILFALARRADNQHLVLGSSDAGLYELDMAADKPERIKFTGTGHRSYVTGVAVLSEQAVSCSYDGQLVWWDLASREALRAVAAHDKWIRRLVAVPGGKWLVTVADDMRCRVWDAANGERVTELADHAPLTPHHFPSMLYAVAASPDGRWIATGDRVGHIAIWQTDTWSKAAELEAPVMYTWDPKARRHSIGGIRSLAFSADGSQLAVGGTGKINNIDHLEGPARLEIFHWQSGKRLHELEDQKLKGLVEQIIWLPETPFVLSAGGDHKGFLSFYDSASGELIHQAASQGHIHAVAWDATLQQFFVAGHECVEAWAFS
jgi:WD40 repeat protein